MMKVTSRICANVYSPCGEVRSFRTENIFTANGLHDWLRGELGTYIALGEGTREPNLSVQELDNYILSHKGQYVTTATGHLVEGTGYVESRTQLEVLFPIQLEARNFTELGIHSNNHRRLQTYALFRNSEGVPIVITVTPGERIQVLYEVVYRLPAITVFQTVIEGEVTRVTQVVTALDGSNRVRLPTGPVGYIAAPAEIPTPMLALGASGNNATATDGSTYINIPTGSGNFPQGVQVLTVGNTNGLQLSYHLDPPMQKTSVHKVDLVYSYKLENI